MEDYNIQDNSLTNSSIILLDRILDEHQRLKMERIIDVTFCRTIDSLSSQVENVKLLIKQNPKFDWVLIKIEANRMIACDKNITGIKVELPFKDCEKGKENWGIISGKINKAS
jgi:hypothetical protein